MAWLKSSRSRNRITDNQNSFRFIFCHWLIYLTDTWFQLHAYNALPPLSGQSPQMHVYPVENTGFRSLHSHCTMYACVHYNSAICHNVRCVFNVFVVSEWLRLLPLLGILALLGYLTIRPFLPKKKKQRDSLINLKIQKENPKVVNEIDIEDLNSANVCYCRCWRSKTVSWLLCFNGEIIIWVKCTV